MHFLALLWLPAKIFHFVQFAAYRFATWTGTSYLYKRGRRERKPGFVALAAMVYAASWLAVLSISRGAWDTVHSLFAGITHHIG
ncbi:MAG TPA: hypothetical protein VNI01_08335 [Elusimicrobiota bacterium]|jgi:hypothetical protein|nr:hypothetical protein [Elusimicrobiota bacterium]